MNKSSCLRSAKTEPANPLLNAAIVAAVALTVLPAAIFGAVRIIHSGADTSAKPVVVEETAPKRISAAERRVQRLEALRAKETKAQDTYPEITMEKIDPYYDGFETDYDADMGFNNGFGMMPPAYMGGPGMMPPAYMGGPGMMPPAYIGGPGMMPDPGDFNEVRRMPGAEMSFNNGFGRGRGNF
jgi:hypothetical protein